MKKPVLALVVMALNAFAFRAEATLFEVQCFKAMGESAPEFTILTEDRMDYTFSAFTKATQGKALEPRIVLQKNDQDQVVDKGGEQRPSTAENESMRTLRPKHASVEIETVHYLADEVEIRSEFFANSFEERLQYGVHDGAKLKRRDGGVVANFFCRRLQ